MTMFLKRYLTQHRVVKPLLLLIILALGTTVFMYLDTKTTNPNHRNDTTVRFNDVSLRTMVVDNGQDRATGLSDHEFLADDEAMLFVFEVPGTYSFWMKDMDFPIDIFWLNEDKEVVFIKENADPDDYPESYRPTAQALYVLETVADFSETNGVEIGSQFSW